MKDQTKALGASLLATVTALLPNLWWVLVLLSASAGLAGGSLAVRLTAYRVYLFPVSVLALAAGFYLAYWRRL